jgi:uncharacterized membrane protein YozB (DUF420 family)
MDAKVVYWTGALINMAVLTGFAVAGVRQIRRHEVQRHRRSMITAGALVIGFIVSYGLKLAFLGREELSSWSSAALNTLRFHELCVLVMVIGGALALRRGLALQSTNSASDDGEGPEPAPGQIAGHRLAGRIALYAAVLGFASATFVLAGMFARL